MAHERERRTLFVDADHDRIASYLAARHTGRLPGTEKRSRNGRARPRVAHDELDAGEIIQSNEHLQRNPHDLPARVVRVGRNSAWVVLDAEERPRLASLRRKGEKMQAMLAPGDYVEVRILEDESVVVERVRARSFTLERRTVTGRTKTMAANVDTIAVVAALTDPPVRLSMIDQLIAFAELQELNALLLLTKVDLTDGRVAAEIQALYSRLEYRTLIIQPKMGAGIDALREALHGSHALLVGQSGVGKSSIFRALGGTTEVGEVSRLGRGRQTTTAARLFRLADGFLIDSPGVGAFELGEIAPRELAEAFVEIAPLSPRCRFRDCAHLAEPGCAVREAAEAGAVAPSRYESYRLILARADPLSAYGEAT
ncbi:MAG: ribosome small subunit-dependent GTPase A [Candidatus Eremiobacteraeota bacterium]|nr:ribosome small subunit-dependent GTPase A [Candidatus Eremiobacteraeota bacterium]